MIPSLFLPVLKERHGPIRHFQRFYNTDLRKNYLTNPDTHKTREILVIK